MAEAELVHCPACGIKTIPELEDKLCDECYARVNSCI